jgi:hypothetical protein
LAGTGNAKTETLAIPWIYVPMASKLRVVLQGNPPPTSSLRPLSELRVSFVKLGPSRVAQPTLNKMIYQQIPFL